MKTLIAVSIAVMISSTALAQTKELSFDSIWSQVRNQSPALQSSELQTEATLESQSRASRHWLPKVYLDARSYRTNDPGNSFFGLLEQRSLKQTDFNPDTINHPDAQTYTRGALGIDLALYEGGMKSTQVGLLKHAVAAQENTRHQTEVEQYSMVGLSYGSIGILKEQIKSLQSVNIELSRLIKNYQLGSKANPVGYSGLLGMKALANRISGLINQYEAQSKAYYQTLQELGIKDLPWTPRKIETEKFLQKYFVSSTTAQVSAPSFKVEAMKASAKMSEQAADMEKAKFLPRIGAFAESFVFNGHRDTADGYSAGLYLQWSLFDPNHYGSLKEAKLKSMATAKYSEAIAQQERAEHAALSASYEALRANTALLKDSYALLMEQSKMSQTLFKNGSINALQIVEILNRQTDLITQQLEAELGLLKVGVERITKQKFEIGVQNEN